MKNLGPPQATLSWLTKVDTFATQSGDNGPAISIAPYTATLAALAVGDYVMVGFSPSITKDATPGLVQLAIGQSGGTGVLDFFGDNASSITLFGWPAGVNDAISWWVMARCTTAGSVDLVWTISAGAGNLTLVNPSATGAKIIVWRGN